MTPVVNDHDFVVGKGGFWVTEEGGLIPVTSYAEHIHTLKQFGERFKTGGYPSYDKAYDAGWIRLSFYGDRDISANFNLEHVTIPALRTMAKVLRHERAGGRDEYTLTREDQPYWIRRPNWSDRDDRGEPNPDHLFRTTRADVLARKVMRYATEKNAAVRGLPTPPPPNMAEVGIAA